MEQEEYRDLYLECLTEGWKELQEILAYLGAPLSEDDTPEKLVEETWDLYGDDLIAHMDGQAEEESKKLCMIAAIRDNSESLFGADIRKYFECEGEERWQRLCE